RRRSARAVTGDTWHCAKRYHACRPRPIHGCPRERVVVARFRRGMRRVVAVAGAALAGAAASCAPGRWSSLPLTVPQPSSAWVAPARRPSPLLATVRARPELADLVLYLEAREAALAGDDAGAVAHVAELADRFPDSIWTPSARLLAGQLRRRNGDLDGAR